MRRVPVIAVCQRLAAVAALTWCTAAIAIEGLPQGAFPVGRPQLAEQRRRQEIAPGLIVHVVRRGTAEPAPGWLLTAGIARTASERTRAARCLRRAGSTPIARSYPMPDVPGRDYVEVTGGHYGDEVAAERAAKKVSGCVLKAQAMAASPLDRGGPWRLHIVEIRPRLFRGRLASTLARGRETVSTIARRTRALVAINGGFFVMNAGDGVVGEPAGIAVIDGQVRSEPTVGRSYLLLSGDGRTSARIGAAPANRLHVDWSDGSRSPLDGVDRVPGLVRNCGMARLGAMRPPVQDETCRPTDDLVAITPQSGFVPDVPGVVAALVTSDGHLAAARLPRDGELLLAGIGRSAALLQAKRKERTGATVDLSFAALSGEPGARGFAVNGGPLLIRDGKMVHDDGREGWRVQDVSLQRATFVHEWTTLRNPRTAVGIGAEGTIWLVVIEGREFAEAGSRDSAVSAGLSIEELRRVMAHLGARDAINLDGGGSSVLVVDGKPVTKPSDPSGERAIGDAIILTR